MRATGQLFALLALLALGAAELRPASTRLAKSLGASSRRRIFHESCAIAAGCLLAGAQRVSASVTGDDFRSRFKYEQPSDFVNYLREAVPQKGDADAVLRAMDEFANYYPMYKLSPLKASILTTAVRKASPTTVLEIGSFFGYSAIHLLRTTSAQGSSVTCLEGNEQNVAVMRAVLDHAFGASSETLTRLHIVPGLSSDSIKLMPQKPQFDFVFLDHEKSCYLPDLRLLEARGLLAPRCTVVADNVIFPGTPDYLSYVSSGGGWNTVIESAPFERIGFETKYQVVDDGMSISTKV